MSEIAQWTWIVYMAGDNNLEDAGRSDLGEMKRIGSTADVNVVVQFDTESKRTTRYRVEKNRLKTIQEMPGVDCGDPKVLAGFAQWAVKTFPARHYLLDVWNHGGGWENLPADYDYDSIRLAKPTRAARLRRLKRSLFRTTVAKIHRRGAAARAIAIDCGSHDYLDNRELRSAVSRAFPPGRKLDVLGCDACLMNMIEIAYEMKDGARFMVGSEETEPAAGWPYAAILKALVGKPATSPADLAKRIVVEYGRYFKRRGEAATQSALDLSRVTALAGAVDELAVALLADLEAVAGTVSLARDRAQKFEMPEYVDLGDFAAQLAKRLPRSAAVQAAAAKVRAGLDPGGAEPLVIGNATAGASVARSTGVSIYYPHREDYSPDYAELRFSRDVKWHRLLQGMFKA
ncbi:MAG: hypothetical protein LAO51_04190 [Acidobacteriia bacterium]|nr:hypothetical protein [Terriglobia bacterium]